MTDTAFTGVDLNGTYDSSPIAEYSFGPRSYWYDLLSSAYNRVQPNPFWGAQIGLAGGIQAIRIETSENANIASALLDWRLGWDGPSTSAPRLPFATSGQAPISFNFQHDNVTYNMVASVVTSIREGQTRFDLNLKTANNDLMPNPAAQELLRQVGLSYKASDPAAHSAQFDLSVKISADGSTWTGAQAGQAGTLAVKLDAQPPVAFLSTFKDNQVEIYFNDGSAGKPINALPDTFGDPDWKLGQPNVSFFSVRVDGVEFGVTQAVIHNSVVLTLDRPIPSTANVVVSYTAPSSDLISNVVQDWQGNDARFFTNMSSYYSAKGFYFQVLAGAELGWDEEEDVDGVYLADDASNLGNATVIDDYGDTILIELRGDYFTPNPSYNSAAVGFRSFQYSREWMQLLVNKPAGAPATGGTIPLVELLNPNTPYSFTSWERGVEVSKNGIDPFQIYELVEYRPRQAIPLFGPVYGSELTANAGMDSAQDGPGDDRLALGKDDDTFIVGGANSSGNDTLDGGENGKLGDTVAYYRASAPVTVNLTTGQATGADIGIDVLVNIEHVVGSNFDDTLTGNAGINFFRPNAGNDVINGMGGKDVVMYEGALSGVTVDLQSGVANGTGIGQDTLISIENLHTTYYNDIVRLSNEGSYVFARAGNDNITGGSGNDNIMPGSGNDTVDGGNGWDSVGYMDDGYDQPGGAGVSSAGVTVNLQTGTATDNWGEADTLLNIEEVSGSNYADLITGSSANNGFVGLGGNDQIDGGGGTDWVRYQGNRSEYTVTLMPATDGNLPYYQVTDSVPDRDGTDTLRNIETLNFKDVSHVLDGSAGGGGMDPSDFFKIDPSGSYLADKVGIVPVAPDNANAPTRINLSEFNAAAGSVIALSATGTWQAGSGNSPITGQPFADVNTSLVAVFVDASGNPLAPEAHLRYTTSTQSSGMVTNIAQDFYVVSGGVTRVKVPTNAVALEFSVNDIWYQNNLDPNNDFGVLAKVMGAGTSYDGHDLLMGTSFDDTLSGSNGNDSLSGGPGNDLLQGNEGRDVFWAGTGADTIEGGQQMRLPWQPWFVADIDRIESSANSGGMTVNLTNRTVMEDGATDSYSGIEEIYGTYNRSDSVTGRTSDSATVSGGSYIFLYLRGGNDTVNIAPYGHQQPWSDGAHVGYHWSKTPITATANPDGRTITVNYSASTGSDPQAAGSDTLTHVGILGDSVHNDSFDLRNLKYNQLGYITDPYSGGSDNTVFLGWGGSDTVFGNGSTAIHFGTVTETSNTLGVNIDLASGSANLGHLSTNGYALGTVTFTGVRTIAGSRFADTLTGGADDDFEAFRGAEGNDTIDGRTGYDLASYRWSAEGITVNLAQGNAGSASQGMDTLRSIEAIRGSNLGDIYDARGFEGGYSSVFMNVGSYWWGLNAFVPEGGDDIIHGNGATRLDYSNAMVPVRVDLAAGVADARFETDKTTDGYKTLGRDTFTGVYGVRGSAFDDHLLGGGTGLVSQGFPFEVLTGNAGNDTLNGLGGLDMAAYVNSPAAIHVDLPSGTVSDGWGFIDTLVDIEGFIGSYYDDTFTGNANNQTFVGGKGADSMQGAGGHDEVGYNDDEQGVTVRLAGWVGSSGGLPMGFTGSAMDGWGTIDVFTSIEGVEGSPYNDTITGDGLDNRLDGRGGNDMIDGGGGNDWVEYNQAMDDVHVDLSLGKAFDDGQGVGDVAQGVAVETDTLFNIENVEGGYSHDTIVGNDGANHLMGNAGNDFLYGKTGNDTLNGGLGDDTVRFNGNRSEYSWSYSNGQGTISGPDGQDSLLYIERLQFDDGQVVLANFAPAVDLGRGDYGLSPVYYWPGGNARGYSKAQPNPFGEAVLTSPSGLKSLVIKADKNAEDLGPLSVDWRLGWHPIDPNTGEISAYSAPRVPFGQTFAPQTVALNVNGQNINLRLSALPRTEANKTLYDLKIEAADASTLSTNVLQEVLRLTGIEFRGGSPQGQADHFVMLTVLTSADGVSYLNTGTDPASQLELHLENVTPAVSAAYFHGNVINLQFSSGGRPTDVASMNDTYHAWLGLPPTNAFVVKVNGVTTPVIQVNMTGNVLLQLASPIPSGAAVTVSYTDPAGDQVQNVVQRWNGLDVQSTPSPLTAQFFNGVRIEALSGAVLGLSSDKDFPWGTYIGSDAEEADPKRVMPTIKAVGADTFTIEWAAPRLSESPAFDPYIPSGFRSYRYTGEKLALEMKKQGGQTYTVGAPYDLWSIVNTSEANTLLFKSFQQSILAGNSTDVNGAVTFDLARIGPVSDTYLPINTLIDSDNLWGSDEITGSAYNDDIQTSYGRDTITGGAGNDIIDGGDGNDTAIFSGPRSQYTITYSPTGFVTVTDNTPGRDGSDTLYNVENLRFADDVPPPAGGLQGHVYHWKSHVLLSNTKVQIQDNKAIEATPGEAFDLRAVNFDAATGKLTVEVWVNPTAEIGNFDFTVGSASASAINFTSALPADWTVIPNTGIPGNLLVSGFSLSALSSSTRLGTLELNLPASSTSASIGFFDIVLGNQNAAAQSIALASQVTGTDGKYNFTTVTSGMTTLNVSRAAGDGTGGVNSADALAALKIAVGINPNPDPDGAGPLAPLHVSPYQIIAADTNKDGKVNSADALAILKMAVKLSTATPQEWLFVNEKIPFWNGSAFTLTRTNANWEAQKAITATLPADATTNMVGVLLGDVNGSWAAPSGSQDLDLVSPNYFQNLATLMGVPTDLWGGL